MKIGIITMYFNSKNSGGLLQAYALCKVIQKLGFDVEQICYEPSNLPVDRKKIVSYIDKKKKKYWLTHIWKNPSYVVNKIKDRLVRNNNKKVVLPEQNYSKFIEFEKSIPHSAKVYDESTLNELNGLYDKYICGSDQVWHLSYLAYEGYFLDFVKLENKCVAYAVSTGKICTIPIEDKILKMKLAKFNVIGVREKTFAKSLSEKYSVNVRKVLDPVFLLDKKEWMEIENVQILPKQKYIFVYLLGNENWHEEYIDKYARDNNLKVVFWNQNKEGVNISRELLIYKEKFEWGPREFISFIHHAEIIFTDSFHATAFSILYEKRFYVFKRDKGSKLDNMNFRIIDILEEYKLKWRIIDSLEQPVHEEKNERYLVNNLLCEQREASLQFLKEQLNR